MTAGVGNCDHCGLSIGVWPHERDIDGVDRQFCCYGCFIGWQVARGGGEEATAVGLLIRLGVGGFLAMNIMMFSLAVYSGDIGVSDPAIRQNIHYALWFFATPVLVILGGPFFAEAATGLLHGRLNASVLIGLGALAAYAYSVIVTINGGERVYFDTATMVLGLFTLGRFLEANGRARAMRTLAPMLSPHLTQVSLVNDETERLEPLSKIVVGDRIRVQPGNRICVDGMVESGQGFIDTSWLTGESLPQEAQAGVLVQAGSINLDGVLIIRATTSGLETNWASICASLHDSLRQSTTLQTVTDRVAVWFVPAVLLIAIFCGWYWAVSGPTDIALMNALAVLVVACPCALGLAAPLATAVGLEELAKRRCLVRSGDTLYQLAGIRGLAIDKTGTLTGAVVHVADIITDRTSEPDLLRRAASVEVGSRHPVGIGILNRAAGLGVSIIAADRVRTVPGRGVFGQLEGSPTMVGTERFFIEADWEIPAVLMNRRAKEEEKGRTGAFVGWDGSVRGLILLFDELRPQTAAAITRLKELELELVVLSGDRGMPVERAAQACGINVWRSELLPQEKADFIVDWKKQDKAVAMIGDGINDALALQTADVGISMGTGVDLARETAEVVLPEDGLSRLPDIIVLARRAKRLVMSNLVWALTYNAVAIGLAATGHLKPVFAAALMAGSSFVVIANSLRLSRADDAGRRTSLQHPSTPSGNSLSMRETVK